MRPALSAFDIAPEEFRSRVAHAKASGAPLWLWPEVAPEAWRTALGAIERVTREVMIGGTAHDTLTGDPVAIGLAGYTSGMGPLLGHWIGQGMLEAAPPVAEMLELHLQHNRLRMERMAARAGEAVRALAKQGIPVCVLKGMHSAFAYFPDPATRPCSDIDLLVPAGDHPRANMHFEGAGFLPGYRSAAEQSWHPAGVREPRSLMFVHADNHWTIDLHNSLNYAPASTAAAARLDDIAAAVPGESWLPDPSASVLGQPLLLLHLAAHASCKLHTNLTLMRLVELALVARTDAASGRLQWNHLLALGAEAGALGIVYPALRLCEQLVPGTIPEAVLTVCERAAPAGVRAFVAGLTPATAQRLDGVSITEHFMWGRGLRGKAWQAWRDLLPKAPARALLARYAHYATLLARRRLRS